MKLFFGNGISGKTKNGKFSVMRHTIKKRLRAKIKALKSELRDRMHDLVIEVGKWLKTVVKGHYGSVRGCKVTKIPTAAIS